MKIGVVRFPGSNCDFDCLIAFKEYVDTDTQLLWYTLEDINKYDLIVLPGGFSYGDYLRAGAMARFSPLVERLNDYIMSGKLVIGICNGFQILTEAGFLPGALCVNRDLRFICRHLYIRCENFDTPFTNNIPKSMVLKIPIAHGEGRYYVDDNTLLKMKKNGQIAFRYCNQYGDVSDDYNPNGSLENIAGVFNKTKNCLGMMPHPERAIDSLLGSEDGIYILQSIRKWLKEI